MKIKFFKSVIRNRYANLYDFWFFALITNEENEWADVKEQ